MDLFFFSFCAQDWLQDLNPLGDMEEKEFCDYLYKQCLEIEPRDSRQPAKFVS